jgi:hypothetical protein
MRLAVFSDIHGNPIALDAVLSDIEDHGGADGFWVLGDVVAMGFDPAAVLQRLTALPNARFVRGNTDRYVLIGQGATARGPLTVADAQANPDLVPSLVGIAQGLAWTHGYLSATGWIDWLAGLPLEQRFTLPDGTRLLGALRRVADHHAVLQGTVGCGKGYFKHGAMRLAESDVDRRHDGVDVRPDPHNGKVEVQASRHMALDTATQRSPNS